MTIRVPPRGALASRTGSDHHGLLRSNSEETWESSFIRQREAGFVRAATFGGKYKLARVLTIALPRRCSRPL
jgi:hypothetical protein